MTGLRRRFVDGLLALLQQDTSSARELSAAERGFVDGFLRRLAEHEAPSGLSDAQRRFVDGFVARARPSQPAETPAEEFRRVVMERWELITWRAHGAVAIEFTRLEPERLRMLTLLEQTPPLLAPLNRSRDEVTHSALLGWALRRPGALGTQLRSAFLRCLDQRYSLDGWLVETERTLGKGCRVDVDITVPGAWRCMIEMKVDAQERDRQLDDYREHLDQACDDLSLDGTLVFLTLDGRKGKTRVDHTRLSFKRILGAWLPLTVRHEPDALYLRLWLASVARDFCGLGVGQPLSRWSFSQRIAALDFLNELGERDV
ncbi:MAG: PD-(D/E)XK nuclease family protein [Alphaproteobacteria bacterium]|nr:PD-(D/E)XK nuclease family protein [Alphaproteobacteria bacterium]